METICLMRDICRAIETFEADFVKVHHMSLNEGMLLCSLSKGQLSAACLAEVNVMSVSYTHLRAHETLMNLVCRLLLEKKKL